MKNHILCLILICSLSTIKALPDSIKTVIPIGSGIIAFFAAGELAEAERENGSKLRKAIWAAALNTPLAASAFTPGSLKQNVSLAACFTATSLLYYCVSPKD